MLVRSGRTTVSKQGQYRIPDDETESDQLSTPSKKAVGGVLAALSNNVPVNKNQEGCIKAGNNAASPRVAKAVNGLVMTPPPRSVVLGKDDIVSSPLTQPRVRGAKMNHQEDPIVNEIQDQKSVASSPSIAGRNGQNMPFDEDEDEDDDVTLERTLVTMDLEAKTIDDQTSRGPESEDEHNKSQDDSEEPSEDEYDESETESEDESEEEPDDDEYIPEDEDDSCSEDLDDYVEDYEEKSTRGRAKRTKSVQKEKSSKVKPEQDEQSQASSNKMFEDHDSMVSSIDKPTKQTIDTVSSKKMAPDFDEKSSHTITPLKKQLKDTVLGAFPTTPFTPESLLAVVVDDDEDVEDDVLVATIIEDAEPVVKETDRSMASCGDDSQMVENEEEENSRHAVDSPEPKEQLQSIPKKTPQASASKSSKKSRKNQRKSFFRGEGKIKRGKWTLGSKIGVGSFGVVHVGMNNETGKLMAVKKFKMEENAMKDIRTEIELMRSLKHKNIVRYLGAQMDKSDLHIFQEWVPGGSVATLLSRFGPFSLKVIRSYLEQTLQGLAYLHSNDIMHRDIKGSNILVNDEGIVKLADFGASKKLKNLKDNMMMSLTVRGTPYFMAPEVFEEKYSAKADVWGVGCVAYQMITGTPPWKDRGFTNPISLFNHIKKHDGPPSIDSEIAEKLEQEDKHSWSLLRELLGLCFDKNPSSRPTIDQLLGHKFFLEVHDDADDETTYSRGIFSPSNETAASGVWMSSPDLESFARPSESPALSPRRLPVPSPKNQSRSKSVVQWKTTFASPQRPKRILHEKKSSPYGSPRSSPKPDTSDWPEWAKEELRKRGMVDATAEQTPNDEKNLSGLMGSLALSEDSVEPVTNAGGRDSQTRSSTLGTQSKLLGLNFLEQTTTYEI